MGDFWNRTYESTKNIFVYAKKGVLPVFSSIMVYLIFSGMIADIETSGDSFCRSECYAYVNITGKAGYTIWLPFGTIFETEPQIDVEAFRKVDGEWVPLDRFYISSGKNEYMFVGKKEPEENIKWTFTSFFTEIDPWWNGTAGSDSFFALVENDNYFTDNFESHSKVNWKGLELWFPMDVDENPLTDYSHNGWEGILKGVGEPDFVIDGKYCGAYDFDGVDDYFEISSSEDIYTDSSYSVAFWVKIGDKNSVNDRIFDKQQSGPVNGSVFLYDSPGRINFTLRDNTTTTANLLSPELKNNTWYHVVGVFDSDNSDSFLYINGTLVDSDTSTTTLASNVNVSVGRRVGGGNVFNGTLDDLMIFSRVLRPDEVSTLYTHTLSNLSDTYTMGGVVDGCWRTVNDTDENSRPTFSLIEMSGVSENHYLNYLVPCTNYTAYYKMKMGTVALKTNLRTPVNNESTGYRFQIINANNNRIYRANSLVNTTTTTSWLVDTWYYIKITMDGGTIRVYNSTDGHTWYEFLSYVDSTPIVANNYFSFETRGEVVYFDNFLVQCHNSPATTTEEDTGKITSTNNITGSWVYYDPLGDSPGETRVTFRKTYANYPKDDYLVSVWEMDRLSNSTFVWDMKGLNNGTVTNALMTSNGKYGTSYEFDGDNDYITVPYSDTLVPDTFTLSAWVYQKSRPAVSSGIVGNRDGSDYSYNLYVLANGDITCAVVNTTSNGHFAIYSGLPLNSWNHVVCTLNQTHVSLYLNGIQVGTQPPLIGNMRDNSQNILIGMFASGNPPYSWNGTIDEVMIWNTSLNDNEIEFLYNTQYHYETPVSVGYWNFDGENLNDVSLMQNGNDGSATGATWTTSGKYGGAYYFSGDDTNLNMGTGSSLDIYPKDISISLWAKADEISSNTFYTLIDKGNPGSNGYLFRYRNTPRLEFRFNGVSSTCLHTPILGQWYHYGVTYDGNNVKFYVNGTLTCTVSRNDDIGSSSDNFYVGARSSTLDEWNGTIDEVMVFSKTLTPTEIWNIYNSHYTLDSSATSSSCLEAWDAYLEQIDDSTTGDRSTDESQMVRIDNTDSTTPQFPTSGWIPPTGGTGKYDTGFTPYAICTDNCLEYANVLVYNLTHNSLVNVSEYVYGQSNFTWDTYVNTSTWTYGQYYYRMLCEDAG